MSEFLELVELKRQLNKIPTVQPELVKGVLSIFVLAPNSFGTLSRSRKCTATSFSICPQLIRLYSRKRILICESVDLNEIMKSIKKEL